MFSHFLYLFYNYVYDQKGPYGWAHERLRETNKVIFRCDSNDLVRFWAQYLKNLWFFVKFYSKPEMK